MLSPEEKSIYEWQMWVRDFGASGQEKLKSASVLVSRIGGLGGVVAYELAAAGIGKLILAHAGNIKPSDLNRQLLMTHAALGTSRVECAKRRLSELNPYLEIEAIPQNISWENAEEIVGKADLVVDCAPLFVERYAMNAAARNQGKPMVECAMHDLEAHITTFLPGKTGCLRCLFPEDSTDWKRQFPVFGAVSGTVGCMGAMEAIKVLAGFGEPLANRLLSFNLRTMEFRKYRIGPDPHCPVCSNTDGRG
jgi:molybdopterin/thiamine biosynthesis adenylyltransferase